MNLSTTPATGIPTADIAAGMYAARSAISALFRRDRTGQGAVIDVSMFDSAVEWMGHPLYMQLYGGRQIPRMGLSHAAIARYDAYPQRTGRSSSVSRTTVAGGPSSTTSSGIPST